MEVEVRKAAFAHVRAWALTEVIPPYWANKKLPTTPADAHVRVSVMPVDPMTVKTCGKAKRLWLLQVLIYVRAGDDDIKPSTLVDSLIAATPYGTVMTFGGIEFQVAKVGRVAPAVHADAWYYIPVQFRLRAFA